MLPVQPQYWALAEFAVAPRNAAASHGVARNPSGPGREKGFIIGDFPQTSCAREGREPRARGYPGPGDSDTPKVSAGRGSRCRARPSRSGTDSLRDLSAARSSSAQRRMPRHSLSVFRGAGGTRYTIASEILERRGERDGGSGLVRSTTAQAREPPCRNGLRRTGVGRRSTSCQGVNVTASAVLKLASSAPRGSR